MKFRFSLPGHSPPTGSKPSNWKEKTGTNLDYWYTVLDYKGFKVLAFRIRRGR